jgi:hypothetical protein
MKKILRFFKSFEHGEQSRVEITSYGLALGIVLGLSMILYSILASLTGYGIEIENIFESLLPGYTLTIPGTIVGVVWMFSIGYVYGTVFSWIYNKLVKKPLGNE